MHLCLFHKLIFLVLLVSAEENQLPLSQNESSIRSVPQNEGSSLASVRGMHNKAVTELRQRRQQQEQKQEQQQQSETAAHSLDQFFASKRSVPNTSDPLHNR